MKILITGGAGYVGSVLTQELLRRGDQVRVFDRLQFGTSHLFPFFQNPDYELVKGDIRDGYALKDATRGMDAIVHLAAVVGYPACDRDPTKAKSINVDGTRMLDLVRNGHPVIYASTGSVYGKVEGVCTEETPTTPLTVYGQTKLEAERIILRGNGVALRFATAFGLSPRMRLDLLPNTFTYEAVQNRALVIYEAHYRRTFIHVADMARAFIHALDNYETMQGQVYNCGANSLNATKAQLAEIIQSQVDYKYHLADIGNDADQRDYEVDYSKIEAIGYKTIWRLDQGIQQMVKAFEYLTISNPFTNVG